MQKKKAPMIKISSMLLPAIVGAFGNDGVFGACGNAEVGLFTILMPLAMPFSQMFDFLFG